MILRLWGALSFWIDGDEGTFLYDALLWNKGFAPFKDFLLGSPLYIFLIRFTTLFFGRRLFAGRVISVILSTATIYLIYLIGMRLWNKKAALIAAFIFAVSPFTIFWGSAIKTEPNVSFFAALAFYLVLVSYHEKKGWLVFLSGLSLGLGAYIRLSAFVFLPAIFIFIAYYYLFAERSFKKFLINSFYLFSGFALVYSLITLYLASGSSYSAVIAGWSPWVAGTSSYANKSLIDILSMRLLSLLGWFVRINRDAGYFIVFPLLFILINLKRIIKNNNISLKIGFLPLMIFGALMLLEVVFFKAGINYYYLISLIALALLLTASFTILKNVSYPENKQNTIFIVTWFVFIFTSYIWFGLFTIAPSYYYELTVPASLFGGYLLSCLEFKKKNVIAWILLLASFSIWIIMPYIFYEKAHGESRYWSANEIAKITGFLTKRGIGKKKSDVFLAGNMVVLYIKDLRSYGNISHPVIYFGEPSMTDEKLMSLNNPTQPQIIKAMQTGDIKFILWDKKTSGIFENYPKIIKTIQDNYYLYKNITSHTKLFIHSSHKTPRMSVKALYNYKIKK